MSYSSTGYNATQMQSNDGHSLAKARDKASSARNKTGAVPEGWAWNNPSKEGDVLDNMLKILSNGY